MILQQVPLVRSRGYARRIRTHPHISESNGARGFLVPSSWPWRQWRVDTSIFHFREAMLKILGSASDSSRQAVHLCSLEFQRAQRFAEIVDSKSCTRSYRCRCLSCTKTASLWRRRRSHEVRTLLTQRARVSGIRIAQIVPGNFTERHGFIEAAATIKAAMGVC